MYHCSNQIFSTNESNRKSRTHTLKSITNYISINYTNKIQSILYNKINHSTSIFDLYNLRHDNKFVTYFPLLNLLDSTNF